MIRDSSNACSENADRSYLRSRAGRVSMGNLGCMQVVKRRHRKSLKLVENARVTREFQ
jgi:hypothetical protein